MKIKTGKGTISLVSLLAIWSVSAVVSLPGLAVSPIMGDLTRIFPHSSDLEIQMLASLPSLLIVPFVLLSGRLSIHGDKLRLLFVGLGLFFISGVLFLFARSMTMLIVLSSILGIGGGIVIPLSTGLVADYFSGPYRTRQLGLSSAINNLSLVLASLLTGWLAQRDWHYPFAVYLLPGITIVLCLFLRREKPARVLPTVGPASGVTDGHRYRRWLAGLMVLHFFTTYSVLAIDLYLPFLVQSYGMKPAVSGMLISVFFLAITLPGFFLNRMLRVMRDLVTFWSLGLMTVGLLLSVASHGMWAMLSGCVIGGFGYGVLQPLIYEKTADIAPPGRSTMALSLVMSVNYLAILVCPFIVDFVRRLFHTESNVFPFLMNAVLTALVALWAYFERRRFVYGLDSKYFKRAYE